MTTDALCLELPKDLPLDEWAKIGRDLTGNLGKTKWQVGDWAAYGDRKYGKLKEFADANGINYQTLKNIARVSSGVEKSRRRDDLEWGFHEAVCALPPREQTRWLERAHAEGLTVGQLRTEIRTAKGKSSALESDGKVLKSGTKFYYDFENWLKNRPGDFWTPERREVWSDRLRALWRLIPEG